MSAASDVLTPAELREIRRLMHSFGFSFALAVAVLGLALERDRDGGRRT
jgi:hypothetical protein